MTTREDVLPHPVRTVTKTVSGERAAALAQHAASLLQDLPAHPIVNRHVDGTIEMLESGRPIRARGSGRTSGDSEMQTGLRVEGDEHPPIYGALHFGDTLRNVRTGQELLNTGQTRYGPIALVLKPDVLARSTFSYMDSMGLSGETVAPPRALPWVLARSLLDGAIAGRDTYLKPLLDDNAPIDPDALASSLLSDRSTTSFTAMLRGRPEVQIHGGVTRADVREIRVASHLPSTERERLRAAAGAAGIPFRDDDARPPDPNGMQW